MRETINKQRGSTHSGTFEASRADEITLIGTTRRINAHSNIN